MKHLFWRAALVGALSGAGLVWIAPRPLVARASLHFPGVQPQLYLNLVRSLRASTDSAGQEPQLETGNLDLVSVAAQIFTSPQALNHALKQTGQDTGRLLSWQDPLEGLAQRLKVEFPSQSTLSLRLTSNSGQLAHQQLQALLEYYQQFVEKTPLTRVRRTRQNLEAQLTKVRGYLRLVEEKMSKSSSRELRALGDSALKADPKIMAQLWQRRLDEEHEGREILNRLQKIRQQEPGADPAEASWMAEWGRQQRGRPKINKALQQSVPRQDLLQRAELEREYDEALLKHRSLVLQLSFLTTWESLESFDFELIEPISVQPQPRSRMLGALIGGLLGLLLAWLVSLMRRL